MIGLDVRIFRRDLVEDAVKQAVGPFHDVVFDEAGDFLAAEFLRVLKSVADDLFRAGPRDQLEAFLDLIGLAILDAGIGVLFVLADDDDIHYRVLCLDERMIGNARAGHLRTARAFCGPRRSASCSRRPAES